MRQTGSRKTGPTPRRAWTPPAVTAAGALGEAKSPGRGQLAQPRPPAAPATKLGFSFEMAFPLSARFE